MVPGVSKGYVDQLAAFRFQGHTIEAHVARVGAPGARRAGTWVLVIDDERYIGFPASPADTEDEIREKIEGWVKEHLPRNT